MRGDAILTRIAWVAAPVIGLSVVVWLALRAFFDQPADNPQGFGAPGDEWAIVIVGASLVVVCALIYHRGRAARRSGAPIAIFAVLVVTTLVLGMASYLPCAKGRHPEGFYALIWTVALFTGETGTPEIGPDTKCFDVAPAALEVARLSAFAALFLGAILLAGTLLQARLDRLRVAISRLPVTAVVELDDDAQSMVSAILNSRKSRGALVLLTDQPDRPCVHEARNHGARVISVDFNRPKTMTALSLWRRLDSLYLLSPDAWANEVRLEMISTGAELPKVRRLQLVVRIDDPWQAEAWRARLFGQTEEAQWAADAVGKYEVTAHRLLDDIVARPNIDRVIVCGTSRLTLALCSELAQRQAERDYYSAPAQDPLPRMTTVAPDAEEYQRDHQNRQQQLGLASSRQLFDAVARTPTVGVLAELIGDGSTQDPATVAVIFVDPDPIGGAVFDSTTATRLAARFRTTPVFAWDLEAKVAGHRETNVGQLRTYRLALHLPDDDAPDRWERAAILIHSRYAARVTEPTAASKPWAGLDPFYKQSNRLLVMHVLHIVEEIGEHTWNTWNSPGHDQDPIPHDAEPLQQLELMGFDADAATAMAKKEHERWRKYYEDHGWRYGAVRDDDRKLHPSLLDWSKIVKDDVLYDKALRTIAFTLLSLRELGYRSRPVWEKFERVGTVIAHKRAESWTWTTATGDRLTGDAGDWEVSDTAGGDSWSVDNDIFGNTYEHVDGDRWRRRGTVLARRARPGERIATLEGMASVASGYWIVQGEQGEKWPVPGEQFTRRYRRVETHSPATT